MERGRLRDAPTSRSRRKCTWGSLQFPEIFGLKKFILFGTASFYLWLHLLQEAPMGVGVNELLTRLAERLTTLVLMSLVPEQIDVLVAVLALMMILADLLDRMLLQQFWLRNIRRQSIKNFPPSAGHSSLSQ